MKRILILLTICLLFATLTIYAAIEPGGLTPQNPGGMDKMENLGDRILAAFISISYIVSVSLLMYIGIKLMIAAPSEKAQIKGMMVPYVVGAVVAFAAPTFVIIIGRISEQITP